MGIVIAVIIAYMALMLFIGWRASKNVKSSKDYLIGGRRFGVLLTAMAHQAAGLSGWLFTAWSSQVASMGLAAMWTSISSGFAPFVNFFALAKKVSRFTALSGAKSFIDLLEARYYDEDKKIIRFVSAAIIFISITVYMASQLMAAGTTFKVILGWDYKMAIILATIIVTLYTSAGGFLAVVWTDFIQGCLMIFAVLVGTYVVFNQVGGLSDVFAAVAKANPAKMNIWIKPLTIVGLLSAGLLLSDEVVNGVVGHNEYDVVGFGNVDVLPAENVAIGVEYKQGVNAGDGIRNHDYWDAHVAWFVTKQLTLVAAFAETGDKDKFYRHGSAKNLGVGSGAVFSIQYQF